jgi:hypothetical protein
MKFVAKQKARQAICKREMNREKRLIRLMHEKSVMDNFKDNREYTNMYNRILDDTLNLEGLCSTDRKVYNVCQKFIMYNDFKELKHLEENVDKFHDKLNSSRFSMNEAREQLFDLQKQLYNKRNEEVNNDDTGVNGDTNDADNNAEVNLDAECAEIKRNIGNAKENLKESKNKYKQLKEKYNELKSEYYEFRRALTNSEEGRRLFSLCKGIEGLKKYD